MADSPRRKARELVLQALYACECRQADADDCLARLLDNEKLSAKNETFARTLFRTVLLNAEEADREISRLATNWDINRIAAIDRVILRTAIAELAVMQDAPVKVILNEAIELAKKYSTADSSRFINGVLDSFIKQRRDGIAADKK